MKSFIIGTAGHIDHGKTSLVRKLTGVETDRLKEEKQRGITIDLGFAPWQVGPEFCISFIDVPGHEKFVRNMLAGIGGIDLVLMVIAADEGVMPQTREHFAICRLLGISKGIVVLTKSDLVEPDLLDVLRLEIADLVEGSFLEAAPVVAVSSRTGDGIDELREQVLNALQSLSSRSDQGFLRLPIDRVFSMKGFGTVVTGTLLSGQVQLEQNVALLPADKRVRVRSLQVQNQEVSVARSGQRTAVNLAGVDKDEVRRGDVLAAADVFEATSAVDVRLQMLEDASPLRTNAPVHFHHGSSEQVAQIRLLDGKKMAEPGESTYARVVLESPALLLPGDRFVVRRFSPVITIGGGEILDAFPPKIRRKDAQTPRLERLAKSDLSAAISVFLESRKYGMTVTDLTKRTGQPEQVLRMAAGKDTQFIDATLPWVLLVASLEQLRLAAAKAVSAHHNSFPLETGMPIDKLRSSLPREVSEAVFSFVLQTTDQIVQEGENVRLKTHRVQMKQQEQQAFERIETAFLEAGIKAPRMDDVLKSVGVDSRSARTLLEKLIKEKKLVRVTRDFVVHKESMIGLVRLLAEHRGERFSIAQFKEWTGVSRKYAIPILEFLDRQRVTQRDGDARLVL
jgi:selenocysteine-specific elongation factor